MRHGHKVKHADSKTAVHPPRQSAPVSAMELVEIAQDAPNYDAVVPPALSVSTECETFYKQYERLLSLYGQNHQQEYAACEKALAEYCGVTHAIVFSSERSAFQALLTSLSLTHYDRFYVPETLSRDILEEIDRSCAKRVSIPVDLVTEHMNLALVTPFLHTPHTRGRDVICVQHSAGLVFPILDLEQLIYDPEAVIIEDITEGIGALDEQGNILGSCHHSLACFMRFSSGSLIDLGGGAAITTRNSKLAEELMQHRQSEVLCLPQLFLLHAELQNAAEKPQANLQQRKIALKRYADALQEAFNGVSRDRHPQIALLLSDEKAAPSSVLLRFDSVLVGQRKEQIVEVFRKNGLKACWIGVDKHQESPTSFSCFRGMKIQLDSKRSIPDLIVLFRQLRHLLVK